MSELAGPRRILGWRAAVPFAVSWLALAGVGLQAIGASRLLDGVLLLVFATAGLAAGWLLARTGATNARAALGLSIGGIALVLVRLGGLDVRLAAVVVEASTSHARGAMPGMVAPLPIPLMSIVFLSDVASLVIRIFVWAVESLRGR